MFELRAKSDTQADILMYGSVSEWGKVNALDIQNHLQAAKAKGYEKVKFRLNCPGGSIFEGIAIITALQTSGVEVSIAVDGLAASMAAVIITAVDDVEMAEGARLMIHQGMSGAYGQAWQIREQADLLDSLNRTLAEYLSKKTGKEKQWILDNWMAQGKDKWFTAKEALEAKLIKRIIPGKAKPMPKEEATYLEMAAHYEQFFKNENTMNREELIALLGLPATATDAEIKAAMTANKAKADAADAAAKGTPPPATPPAADTTATDKASVTESIVALGKERGMTDAQLASLKVLAGVDAKAALALIPATASAAPETLNIKDLIAGLKGGSSGGSEDRKNWSYDDWQAKDSAGLLKMARENFAAFAKVYEAQFGEKPNEDEIRKLSV